MTVVSHPYEMFCHEKTARNEVLEDSPWITLQI